MPTFTDVADGVIGEAASCTSKEHYKAKYLVSADGIFLLKRTEGEDTLRSFDRTSIHKSRLFPHVIGVIGQDFV